MEGRDDTSAMKYARRSGTSGMGGQLYEVALIANIFWDAVQRYNKKTIESFHLATNMEGAGDFDDIVIKCVVKKCSKVTFIQAKHKEFPDKHKITLDKLLSDTKSNSFNLKKYFNTYLRLKNKFVSNQSSDPIFSTEFQNIEFILLTTAVESFDENKSNFEKVNLSKNSVLNLTKNSCYYKLHLDGRDSADIMTFFESDESDIRDFLNKLKIIPSQPSLEELKAALKKTIKEHNAMVDRAAEQKFATYWQRIQSWWYSGDEYLTECSAYIRDLFDSVYFAVHGPVYEFIGREEQLKELHNILKKDVSNEAIVPHSVTVSGLGGVGKTQMARKYIQLYCRDYGHILWINAENPKSLRDSFLELSEDHLKIKTKEIDGTERPIKCILPEIYKILSDRRYLVVFDNVEEPDHIRNYLPQNMSGPESSFSHVIVTSRNNQWHSSWSVLRLKCFTNDEATIYLEKTLGFASPYVEIEGLIHILEYFPLALYQAAGYIQNQRVVDVNYTVDQYLECYKQKEQEFLQFENKNLYNDYEKTTRTTWLITIDAIKKHKYGDLAVMILNNLAYMAPVNILRDTFKNMIKDEHELKESVRLIVGYSMVQAAEGQRILSIHRLLQSVIRFEIQQKEEEEKLLDNMLTWMNTDQSIFYTVTHHVLTMWDYLCKYKYLVTKHAASYNSIVQYLFSLGKYQDADVFGNTFLNIIEKVCGAENENTLKLKHLTGRIQAGLGLYDKALNIIQETYDTSLKTFGPANDMTMTIQHNLGFVLQEQDKLSEALCVYEDVYKKRMKISGPKDLETLKVRQNIAGIHQQQCKYDEALNEYKAILSDKQIVSTDIDYLTIQHNMAQILQEQNKLSDAIEMYKEVYEKQRGILGPTHPDTLVTQHNMAHALEQTGDQSESSAMYNEVYKLKLQTLGRLHPSTLATAHNLANLLEQQGELGASLKVYESVYDARVELLGRTHSTTLATLQNIGHVYQTRGLHQRALEIYRTVDEVQIVTMGKKHVNTITTRFNIGVVLSLLGQRKEALDILKEVYDNSTQTLGTNHPNTLTTEKVIQILSRQ